MPKEQTTTAETTPVIPVVETPVVEEVPAETEAAAETTPPPAPPAPEPEPIVPTTVAVTKPVQEVPAPEVAVREQPAVPALPGPLQSISDQLDTYLTKMHGDLSQPDPKRLTTTQQFLLRVYHQVLSVDVQWRKQALDLLLAKIQANRQDPAAFADRLIFRGLDKSMGDANVRLFRKLTNLFVNTCDPKGKANVARFVNRAEIIQLLTNPIEQAALLNYYSSSSQAE